MTTQDTDLLSRLHAADLTIDDLVRKTKRIQEDVGRLNKSQRTGMPTFAGPWTKEAIQVHIERVQEWVRTPTRAANRRRLEAIGINGAAIKPEVLDDSDFLDEVLRDVGQIIEGCPTLKPHLVADECLPAWLSRGATEAKQKLAAIEKGLEGYKRLIAIHVAPKHQEELVKKAVGDPGALAGAQATAKQIEAVQELGVEVPESETVAALEISLGTVTAYMLTLQSHFPEQLEALRPSVRGRSLAEAEKIIAAEARRCDEEYTALMAEWQRLERTLRLLGLVAPGTAAPRTLAGLKEQIAEFQKQCSSKVGDAGMSLLAFFQADADFPSGLTLDAVRAALLSLRPLIAISSKAGGQDAKGR